MPQFPSEHHEELPPEYVEPDFGLETSVFPKRSEIRIGHLLAKCKNCLARFGFDRDFFALHDHGRKALFVLMRVFFGNFNIRPISRKAFFLFGNFFREILEQLILQHIPLGQMGRLLQFQFCHIRVKLHLLHNLRISACQRLNLRIRQRRIVHIFGAAHGRL